MTNYEKLMQEMTIEKLVEMASSSCDVCIFKNKNCVSLENATCEDGIREYLNQEVPDDSN